MSELQPPDCKIFVDADIADSELVGLVAQFLFSDHLPECEADIIRNEDYDSRRRQQFPGGFIYFRYTIDLYIDEMASVEGRADLTAHLLERLWEYNFAAVAACSYEDRLPQRGGYQSRSVPWPRE